MTVTQRPYEVRTPPTRLLRGPWPEYDRMQGKAEHGMEMRLGIVQSLKNNFADGRFLHGGPPVVQEALWLAKMVRKLHERGQQKSLVLQAVLAWIPLKLNIVIALVEIQMPFMQFNITAL